jgi:N-acetylglucosamine-6-phosphate deacetylase
LQTYGASNLVNPDDMSQQASPGSISSHVRMITIAPERPGVLDTIKQLSQVGIIMSIGHTAASYQQSRAGIDAGATMITYLYYQMNGHHHRESGPLGILGGAMDVNPQNETSILEQAGDAEDLSTTNPQQYEMIMEAEIA